MPNVFIINCQPTLTFWAQNRLGSKGLQVGKMAL